VTCLALVDERHVQLFMSASILEEVHEVLNRPAIRKSFPMLTDENVQEFLDHVRHDAFRKQFPFLLIVDPKGFLDSVRKEIAGEADSGL